MERTKHDKKERRFVISIIEALYAHSTSPNLKVFVETKRELILNHLLKNGFPLLDGLVVGSTLETLSNFVCGWTPYKGTMPTLTCENMNGLLLRSGYVDAALVTTRYLGEGIHGHSIFGYVGLNRWHDVFSVGRIQVQVSPEDPKLLTADFFGSLLPYRRREAAELKLANLTERPCQI